MPEEMQRLRAALDVRGIEYQDLSDDFDRSFPLYDMTLYRIRYIYKGSRYEVMTGIGTLGCDWGLLELRVNQEDPKGSMTAEGILKLMDRG